MSAMMPDLTAVKVVFVDFDDTLCLHPHHIGVDEFMFADLATANAHFYHDSELNHAVKDFLLQRQAQGCQIILLTATTSKMLPIKQYWLQQNCPEIKFTDYIASSIDVERKVRVITAYLQHFHLPKSAAILIDDACVERWPADAAGILTFNPQLIMNNQA